MSRWKNILRRSHISELVELQFEFFDLEHLRSGDEN